MNQRALSMIDNIKNTDYLRVPHFHKKLLVQEMLWAVIITCLSWFVLLLYFYHECYFVA